MKIIINKDWVVKTDGLNWIVCNPKKNRSNTYHTTLQAALTSCFNRRLQGPEFNFTVDLLKTTDKEFKNSKLVKKIEKMKDEIITAVAGKANK
jgi:hypothetical protein